MVNAYLTPNEDCVAVDDRLRDQIVERLKRRRGVGADALRYVKALADRWAMATDGAYRSRT